jgi:hypothetical protein
LTKVEELQKQYKDKFKLIHLPTHFAEIQVKADRNAQKTCNQRQRLLHTLEVLTFCHLAKMKDNKLQMKNHFISKDVSKKWEQVFKRIFD